MTTPKRLDDALPEGDHQEVGVLIPEFKALHQVMGEVGFFVGISGAFTPATPQGELDLTEEVKRTIKGGRDACSVSNCLED